MLGLLADELRTRGDVVRVPDLRAAVETAAGWPARVAAAVREPADAVLGFSGAGVVLPAVAAGVDARRVVWLDAIVPAERGATVTPAERRARLTGFVRGDRLAAWPSWWPPEVLAAELPDAQLREMVAGEAPELPADFYDIAVPMPAVWPQGDARYVQLSPAYDADAGKARDRGWTVVGEGTGRHLDVVTRAGAVAELLGREAPD